MFARKRIIFFVSLLCLTVVYLSPVFSQEYTVDELGALYGEEIIVTASKRAQKISDSPSAITVVSAEDINQSGAFQLAESFFMVPGMHLGYTSSGYMMAGGIRGFHKLPANKFVLLVDGVPSSFDVYGIPSFNPFPLAKQEIERIEVVRGPGSSLYGANAMFGVVNIITKKPEDTLGTTVALTAGEHNTMRVNYVHGNSIEDKIYYRLFLGTTQSDQWGYLRYAEDPAYRYNSMRSTVDYIIDDNSKLNFLASYADVKDFYCVCETTGPITFKDVSYYEGGVTYTIDEPNILLRTYWQKKDLWDSGWYRGTTRLQLSMGETGVEFQHAFEPTEKDHTVWGANFLQQWAKGSSVGGRRKHDMHGYFIDNTHAVSEKFDINTGLRLDHHPNGGDVLSHRVSLLYDLSQDHNLRFTWGTSFRNPDFIETYYSSVSLTADEDNKTEKAETFEIGYRGKLTEKLNAEANIFYTKVSDLLLIKLVGVQYRYTNAEDLKQCGMEAGFNYAFTKWLSGRVNYTYLEQWEEDISDGTYLEATPQHMGNAELRATFDNGMSANLSVHYRGSTIWSSVFPPVYWSAGGKSQDYLIANLRVGYKFKWLKNDAEFAIAAFNLFDTQYDDYPIGTNDVRRRVTASFTYSF